MCKNDMTLSLSSETFGALKKDFDTIIARTIGNMQMKGAEDATITVKLSVNLEKRSIGGFGSGKDITKPTFKHDISSVMQVKDKMTGQLAGEHQLVWDEDEKKYVLRDIDSDQVSMFDDREEPCGRFTDMDGEYEDVDNPNVIDAAEPLALPGGEEDVESDPDESRYDDSDIDEENMDDEEEDDYETCDDEDEDPEEE